jgi:imidazolonepropionase-like amidohydrolase
LLVKNPIKFKELLIMKAIKCRVVFTGIPSRSRRVLKDQVILIDQGKIAEVKPMDQVKSSSYPDEVFDFTGKNLFVLPGLIDTHLHLAHSGTDITEKADPDPLVALRMAHNAFKNLKAGMTTVRDMGAKNHIDVHFKRGVELGLIPSPRVFICGQPIITTGGHCHYMGREADGPVEVAKAVREQLKLQVDYIKLMVTGGVMTPGAGSKDLQLRREEVEAAVEVAHNAGKMVSSHAQGGPGVRLSIECGADILEHGIYLSEEDIKLMKRKGTYYIPTLTAFKEIAEDGAKVGVPQWAIDKSVIAVESHRKTFQMARKAGIIIAGGTDYRHGTLPDELRLMVQYGASCEEALLAATGTAAKVIGKDHLIGSIEKGKMADFTIVSGDPLKDITALKRVEAVIIGGEIKWRKK